MVKRRLPKSKFKLSITLRKFIENWKGHDYVMGIFTGIIGLGVILLIWNVSVNHLWDLFRLNYADMILAICAMFLFRYCYMLYKKRGIPKFKTDWPIFWDRNSLILGLGAAGILCLALIDPQLTERILNVVR